MGTETVNELNEIPSEGILSDLKIFSWGRSLIAALKDGDIDGIIDCLTAIADLLGYGELGGYVKSLAGAFRALRAALASGLTQDVLGASAAVAEVLATIVRYAATLMNKVQAEEAVKVMMSASPPTLDDLDAKLEDLKKRKVGLDPITIFTLISAFLSIFKNLPDFLAYIRSWWERNSATPQPAVVVG